MARSIVDRPPADRPLRSTHIAFVWLGASMFARAALLNIAIAAYGTYLSAGQGPRSLFATAYGIPVTATEMAGPARELGADAVAVYSMPLGGHGLLSLWATMLMLRGRRAGSRLNAIVVGIAQGAIVHGRA